LDTNPNSEPPSKPTLLGAHTLIVTPTYNEADNLESFVERVLIWAPLARMMIVDDNSPDGTGKLAAELARKDARISVLQRPKKLGLGTAYRAAFEEGLKQGFEVFFEMDADHSHDPRHLPAFFQALEAGADVVVGSRNIRGGRIEGWGPGRYLLSKGGSLYARLVLGAGIRDLTTGYKAFTRSALVRIGLSEVQSNGYAFQIEMTYRALEKGLRVVEVPIVFVDREAGRSKMSRRIVAEGVVAVWKLRWDALRGRMR
jgi:dolichol-phosphate mannosyltransferase